jgi:hypothetical protein
MTDDQGVQFFEHALRTEGIAWRAVSINAISFW